MFGMLDYRAFQLYRLVFFIPNTFLYLVGLFCLPAATYGSALFFYQDYFEAQIGVYWMFIFMVPAYVLLSMLWVVIMWPIQKLFDVLFSIFIDVMPGDGRTDEQAQFVLKTGKKGIHHLLVDETPPQDWTYDMIEQSVNNGDWIQRWFYAKNVRARMRAVHHHSLDEGKVLLESQLTTFLKSKYLEQDWLEWLVTHRDHRAFVLQLVICVYLVSTNPWAY